jgi:hypothetical protein
MRPENKAMFTRPKRHGEKKGHFYADAIFILQRITGRESRLNTSK